MNTETTPAPKEVPARQGLETAYNRIDRYLRNNLDDVDYATFSADLELILAASGAPQEAPGDAPSDSQMLDWLEANKDDVFHNGNDSWTVCYGPHRSKVALSLRAAISAAMKGPQ